MGGTMSGKQDHEVTITTSPHSPEIKFGVKSKVIVILLTLLVAVQVAYHTSESVRSGWQTTRVLLTSKQQLENDKARLEAESAETKARLAAAQAALESARIQMQKTEVEKSEANARARENEVRAQRAENEKSLLKSKTELERLDLQRKLEAAEAELKRWRSQVAEERNDFCSTCCQQRATRGNNYDPAKAIGICENECRTGRPSNWFGQDAVLCRPPG